MTDFMENICLIQSKLTVLEKGFTNDILNFGENDVQSEGFSDFSFEL